MATHKQKAVVPKMIEMGGNLSGAMRAVNYSPNTAHNPQKVAQSKGFKQVLKAYGLTEELITTALVEDIKEKPQERLGELTLGAKILNMTEREEAGTTFNILVVSPENQERYGITVHETPRGTEDSSA